MDDRGFGRKIERLLRAQYVPIDIDFRERLLARCLIVVGRDDVRELDEGSLDLLAAAGFTQAEPLGDMVCFSGRSEVRGAVCSYD